MTGRGAQIFMCYSSHDVGFAQKIARDLDSNGIEVWLDQNDIAAGAHWDRAVEEALEICPALVVVLSPASISSENVLDEVNFAIEEGKIVFPVLFQECRIPFRLRRLQYSDFSRDHETGMAHLVAAMCGAGLQGNRPAHDHPPGTKALLLRRDPLINLSPAGALEMLRKYGFFASHLDHWPSATGNPEADGIPHTYSLNSEGNIVFDRATGLFWQRGGSAAEMDLADGQAYIEKLNTERFGNHADWRLPTLEEAMSLAEPTKKNGDLFIDPIFGKEQSWIWTADRTPNGNCWRVHFLNYVICTSGADTDQYFLRAVR